MTELATIPVGDDPDFDWEQIDKIIWKHAGLKPVRWLAEKTGLTPDAVLRRKNVLFDEVDELTIAQQRHRLVVTLHSIADDAQKAAERSPLEFKAGLINSAIAAIKTVLSQLDRLEKNNTKGVDKLNEMRVRELVSLVQEVVDTSVVQASSEYDIPVDDLFLIFNTNFAKAAEKRDVA